MNGTMHSEGRDLCYAEWYISVWCMMLASL
jgi:hypothetical protein